MFVIKMAGSPVLKERLLSSLVESLENVRSDPEGTRHAALVSVWGRWVIWSVIVASAAYRPELSGGTYLPFVLIHVVLAGCNGLVHYRLARGWAATWLWILFLSLLDIVGITMSIVVNDGFGNFHYVAYYPALALVAVICPFLIVSVVWATLVGALYVVLSLTLDPGLDYGAKDEVVLFTRVVAMYAVVAAIFVGARYERSRRRRLVERERALLRSGLPFRRPFTTLRPRARIYSGSV